MKRRASTRISRRRAVQDEKVLEFDFVTLSESGFKHTDTSNPAKLYYEPSAYEKRDALYNYLNAYRKQFFWDDQKKPSSKSFPKFKRRRMTMGRKGGLLHGGELRAGGNVFNTDWNDPKYRLKTATDGYKRGDSPVKIFANDMKEKFKDLLHLGENDELSVLVNWYR